MDLTIDASGVPLPATLDEPPQAPRGGVVAACSPESEHLAAELPRIGVALLRVAAPMGAAEVVAAVKVLREHTGDVPMGVWGFGDGAVVAAEAVQRFPEEVDFLIGVAASAPVKPSCPAFLVPVLDGYAVEMVNWLVQLLG